MLKFNITDKNYIQQTFPFPSFTIQYLMKNINSDGLKKLHESCKYFYAKLQINIVDEFCLAIHLVDYGLGPYEINLYPNQLDQLPSNLWVSKNLLLGGNLNISKFFAKVIRCNPYDMFLNLETKLTMNELKILTQSKTIKYITIDMIIYLSHDNDIKAPLEDVLSCFLNAKSIR
uniref:F-box domain-containing protein n=1 Tax=Panagrolaimus sp. ES5 TaxID=591445 RepID=A0AC34F0C5_9BILA